MASSNQVGLSDGASVDNPSGLSSTSTIDKQTSVTEKSGLPEPDVEDKSSALNSENLVYGVGPWHPKGLQWMVRPVVFVTLLCFFTGCDAFFSGIQVAVLTTLETRYSLSAYQIGMVVTINKIGTMLGLPVAAYLGGRPNTHRPRWIAGSAFLMALGMVATCIPQFIFGPYQYRQTSQPSQGFGDSEAADDFELCSADTNRSTSSEGECTQTVSSENQAAYMIILISQFVAGVGYAPTRPLGISYIDDNVKPNKAGFYIGVVSSMYGLLVVFGFLASSATELIWVDFYRSETSLTQADQAWVSAWWLLFLFIALLLLLSGIPFLGFPKRLPRQWKGDGEESFGAMEKDREAGDSASSRALIQSLKLAGIKEVFRSLRRIFTNGSYIMASLAFVISGLITGLLSFFPKYMESQFGLPTSLVNVLVGMLARLGTSFEK